LEWTSFTIDDRTFLMDDLVTGTMLDLNPIQNLKKLGMVIGILVIGLIITFV